MTRHTRRSRAGLYAAAPIGASPAFDVPHTSPHSLTLCSVARRRQLALAVYLFRVAVVAALGLPAASERGRVERVARAVAKVLYLVAHERGDEAVGFRARHAPGQLFELFGREEAADARSDLAPFEQRRALGESFVRAPEVAGQNPRARVQGEVGAARLELSHLARHRARAFWEDERRVAAFEERARV